jgi:hypothetical protein
MSWDKYRPEGDPILCNFARCAYGTGQAGMGKCPGDFTDKDCPCFETDEDYERQEQDDSH